MLERIEICASCETMALQIIEAHTAEVRCVVYYTFKPWNTRGRSSSGRFMLEVNQAAVDDRGRVSVTRRYRAPCLLYHVLSIALILPILSPESLHVVTRRAVPLPNAPCLHALRPWPRSRQPVHRELRTECRAQSAWQADRHAEADADAGVMQRPLGGAGAPGLPG